MTTNSEYWDDGMVPKTENFKRLPQWIQMDLTRYLVEGDYGGSDFLYGILANDLAKAVGHADSEHIEYLKDIVMVLFNRMPADCWGTKEKVENWQKIGGWNGFRRLQETK